MSAANSTINSNTHVTIAATSAVTQSVISAVFGAVSSITASDTYVGTGPATPGGSTVLYVAPGATGTVSVASTYQYVLVDQTASVVALTGGSATTTVVGDGFTFNGAASVLATGQGVANINDSLAGAQIDIGSASTVTAVASGNGATIQIGDLAITSIQALGTGDTINIGETSTAATTGSNHVTIGSSDTVNATSSTSTVIGSGSDVIHNASAALFFVGGGAASTVFGGVGRTTVVANTSVVFDAGSGSVTSNNNLFVGGSATSTINAGQGGGSFFGGSKGDIYNIGTSNAQTFVGLGGTDTLSGTPGSVAPTIFATGAEKMILTSGTPQVTVVAFGNGDSVDASATNGNDTFFTGYGATGNETLFGSTRATDSVGAATSDRYIVGASSLAGTGASSVPASVSIGNWHAGDVFFLTGFSQTDIATMDQAISTSVGQGAGSMLSFTLSDRTKITFLGNHPTNFYAPGGSAFG